MNIDEVKVLNRLKDHRRSFYTHLRILGNSFKTFIKVLLIFLFKSFVIIGLLLVVGWLRFESYVKQRRLQDSLNKSAK